MTVEKKKCMDCGASEIYAEGIYCNSCKRFVGRSNEQTCVLTDSTKKEDKTFSEGFMHDIADLLELCMKNQTDNIGLTFEINGKVLDLDITFSVRKEGE
jgi:hypothetical protein